MCTPDYRTGGFTIFLDGFLSPSVAQEDEYKSSVCVSLYSLIYIYIIYIKYIYHSQYPNNQSLDANYFGRNLSQFQLQTIKIPFPLKPHATFLLSAILSFIKMEYKNRKVSPCISHKINVC